MKMLIWLIKMHSYLFPQTNLTTLIKLVKTPIERQHQKIVQKI